MHTLCQTVAFPGFSSASFCTLPRQIQIPGRGSVPVEVVPFFFFSACCLSLLKSDSFKRGDFAVSCMDESLAVIKVSTSNVNTLGRSHRRVYPTFVFPTSLNLPTTTVRNYLHEFFRYTWRSCLGSPVGGERRNMAGRER